MIYAYITNIIYYLKNIHTYLILVYDNKIDSYKITPKTQKS